MRLFAIFGKLLLSSQLIRKFTFKIQGTDLAGVVDGGHHVLVEEDGLGGVEG